MTIASSLSFRALVGSITLLMPAVAVAQQASGFALNRFDPADPGSEWYTTSSLDFRGTRAAFGVVGDWAYHPLVLRDITVPGGRTVVISDQVTAHVGARITVADRLAFGVNVPGVFYANGAPATYNGVTYRAPRGEAGDLRLSGDLLVAGEYGAPVSLSAGVALYAPTGTKRGYTSDENIRTAPRLMLAGDIGWFAYSARVGAMFRPLDSRFESSHLGNELLFGGAIGARFANRQVLAGPELSASTVLEDGAGPAAVELLFAAHVKTGDFRLGFGVGPGLTSAYGTPDVRSILSIDWVPGPDADHDGVEDADDACPGLGGVKTQDPRTNGCPKPPPRKRHLRDTDRDGVPDRYDACPRVAGSPQADRSRNGCPTDRDGDGVADEQDACPDVAGVASEDPKKRGCPADRDSDGVADEQDACPDVAGVSSEDPKKRGCPADTDNDGVLDADDACPKDPGPNDPDPKKRGCPTARVEGGQIKITEQVKFKTGSAELAKDGEPVLQAVLAVLVAHPEFKKLRVEGHTDNRGNAAANKGLSQRRAASVVAWLVAHGIDKTRLAAEGFGSERAIDSNDTEEGRTNNRRVEFHIDGPASEGKPQ